MGFMAETNKVKVEWDAESYYEESWSKFIGLLIKWLPVYDSFINSVSAKDIWKKKFLIPVEMKTREWHVP